jgi:hypothetical protein
MHIFEGKIVLLILVTAVSGGRFVARDAVFVG